MNPAASNQPVHYSVSGVVVRARIDDFSRVAAGLGRLPGVDVHHLEAATGRVVITIETGDHDGEAACLESVRREAGVLSAELVFHYIEPPGSDRASDHGSSRGAA